MSFLVQSLLMSKVNLCETEMWKKNEKQKKNEKRMRKTEKELNLDLAGTSATAGLRGRYSSYVGWW